MKSKPQKSKSGIRVWKVFTLIILIALGSLVAIFIFAANTQRGGIGHELVRAGNSARQIGFALMEFDSDYDSYPNETTAALVSENHPFHGYDLSGSSSNALFRQFFAAELTQSEAMFYARTKVGIKPDGIITPGKLLEKPEVGFSYISGFSSKNVRNNSVLQIPIILAPLVPGTTKFDPESYDGEAVVLYTDNSVRYYKIAKDGHVYDDTGIDILSPENPIWGGKAPDIRYPDL